MAYTQRIFHFVFCRFVRNASTLFLKTRYIKSLWITTYLDLVSVLQLQLLEEKVNAKFLQVSHAESYLFLSPLTKNMFVYTRWSFFVNTVLLQEFTGNFYCHVPRLNSFSLQLIRITSAQRWILFLISSHTNDKFLLCRFNCSCICYVTVESPTQLWIRSLPFICWWRHYRLQRWFTWNC